MFEDIYKNALGRAAARVLATPFVSYAAGAFMDSRLSKPLIKPFARKNGIDLSEAADTNFRSFNAFFTRRLKEGARPVCEEDGALVSPCDGLLSAFPIEKGSSFLIKGTRYSLKDLTGDEESQRVFDGGLCLIFRLTPAHYHRYAFPCDGKILAHTHIKGIYHTVRPTALGHVQVFKTNTREYCLCDCGAFGKMLFMEVGALLVGRIVNRKTDGTFKKGEEKGCFEFGGSTIVVLTQKDRVRLRQGLLSENETPVKLGERIDVR